MSSLIDKIRHGMIWDFPGGVHPPENKVQSSKNPIVPADLPEEFILPLKQHIGRPGDICVNIGDRVLKGQQLTQANLAFMVPVHAPSSGIITAIEKRTVAHPSGLSDLCIILKPDGEDEWCEKEAIPQYQDIDPEALIEKIRQSGISGLGGAGFPTARKLHTGLAKTKILIINAAECEPYITADDRLMQDYAEEVIQGIQVIQHILKPELTIIGIEDNKPDAVKALEVAAKDVDDMVIRVIPTKYPSGASKQLIKVLTGREVPSKAHSAAVGVLMQNVGTAFAIKRAIVDGEPLIERVVTLTGDSLERKGNVFARLGTPISTLLKQFGYKPERKNPRLIMGGSLMGFTLPHADVPITKIANCILAPKRKEMAPPTQEMACIRCTACAEVCPASLLPQQLQWYAKAQDYDKCQEYHLSDCIECGACAYVCPSDIPLVQYYRQAKSEIWTRAQEAKEAERAKLRFEERQKRLERDKAERENRFKAAADKRRSEMKQTGGDDAIAAAIARVKAKQAPAITGASAMETKPAVAAAIARAKAKQAAAAKAGQAEPDNSEMIKLREERKRLARERKARDQQEAESAPEVATTETAEKPKNAAVAAAIARAKARKAAQAESNSDAEVKAEQAEVTTEAKTETAEDPKKAAVAAAIARAKARKAAQAESNSDAEIKAEQADVTTEAKTETAEDPKKAAVAAAIARAKARKAAQAESNSDAEVKAEQADVKAEAKTEAKAEITEDPKKAAVAAAIARAKARKAAQAGSNSDAEVKTEQAEVKAEAKAETAEDPKKAAVAAAIARAKARKAAQAESNSHSETKSASGDDHHVTLDNLDIPVFIDKSSQEKK
ncbi:MAG: electron transport complex subunit RsxC [Vibrio sp.]